MSESGPFKPDGQDGREFADHATAAVSLILSGGVVYGGVGWLLGRWLHFPALLPIGLVFGLVFASIVVYVRYGRTER